MKLKIKYDPTTRQVIRYCCLPNKLARQRLLEDDEILIDTGDVGGEFHHDWYKYTVLEDNTVMPTLTAMVDHKK